MKKNIVFSVIVLFLLASCVSSKNVQNVKSQVSKQKQEDLNLLQKTNELEEKYNAKKGKGELDSHTDSVTIDIIKQLRDSIQNRIKNYDVLLSSEIRKKRKLKNTIKYLNDVSSKYHADLENVLFFDDLLAANTFSKLNTAVFFKSGEYRISDTAAATRLLGNVIESVLNFSKKYSNRTLYASFIVVGYADEENINPDGDLYKDLSKSITVTNPSRQLLNAEVSNRRASAMSAILEKEYRVLSSYQTASNLRTSFFSIGKGEQLPVGDIKDYKPIDDRRRIVLIYWSVLPRFNG